MDFLKLLRNQWDRSVAIATFLAGVISMVLGYVGASSTTKVADQIPYVVSGALVGLFLLGTSATLWLSADLHDEWRKLHEIHISVRR